MAFDATNFVPLSAMANSNAPRMFSYKTTDATATVAASGYFDNAAATYGLQDEDVILTVQSDGTDFYQVDVTSGTVTVALTVAFA